MQFDRLLLHEMDLLQIYTIEQINQSYAQLVSTGPNLLFCHVIVQRLI